jgi:hypothetical protein
LESVHANAQKAMAPTVPADQDAEVTFMIVRGNAEDGPYRCPCCGFITLAERAAFEICDVCYWEDDGRQARRNFEVLGACNKYCAQFVRAPLSEEHPDSGTPHGTGTLYSWS